MVRRLAILVLIATVSTARLPAAPLTATERQHLVAHLETTAAWLSDEVSGLTAAQIATITSWITAGAPM